MPQDNRDWSKRIDYPAAKLLRQTEPYHYQRDRQLFNKQPRAPQAGIQPNQKMTVGWGGSMGDYYKQLFQDYMKKRLGG